jgi:hypothetical protein
VDSSCAVGREGRTSFAARTAPLVELAFGCDGDSRGVDLGNDPVPASDRSGQGIPLEERRHRLPSVAYIVGAVAVAVAVAVVVVVAAAAGGGHFLTPPPC